MTARYLFSLGLMVLLAAPVEAQRPAQRQAERPTDTRQVQTAAAQELAVRPSRDDVRLLRSAALERQLTQHERLLRRAQRIDRMGSAQAEALLVQIRESDDRLIETVLASPGYQDLEEAQKQSCVDERVDCKDKHGAFQGCGIQFVACIIGTSKGKKDEGTPVIGVPRSPPDGLDMECR